MLFRTLLKTAVVLAGGIVGPAVLSAIDHPTGGTASALASNPAYAMAWGAASYTLHNAWDHAFGAPQAPAPAAPQQPSA